MEGGLNSYSYAYANPLLYTDPLGLWSFSFDAYYGFGGGISFGQNPDGSAFLTTRFGYGLGGGFSYDPDGTSPGYSCDDNNVDYVGAGVFGGINGGLGLFYAGLNGSGGARRDRRGSTGSFLNGSFNYGGLLDGKYSLRLGGAVGGEFTFVDSQPVNLAGKQDTCNPCR